MNEHSQDTIAETNVHLPRGFRFSGVACGLKSDPQKLDLSLVVADHAAVAAGVYTTNVVHAASVARNRALTPGHQFRAVVINSGNANACTGQRGKEDNEQLARLTAECCHAAADEVLVLSTGVIGEHLPMDRLSAGVASAATRLARTPEAFHAASRGILTTDQFAKVASREVMIDKRSIAIAAIAKGAGMIAPNMATMLAIVTTDAVLCPDDAQRILADAVDVSFNCISVDGHMSTSDTVLLLASGGAGGEPLVGEGLTLFSQSVTDVCESLAKMIPGDGEGARHRMVIDVAGCVSPAAARQIAQSVGNSPLVKTGIAGNDPNWGRIVSAAGYAGVAFDPDRFQLHLNETLLFDEGAPVSFDERAVSDSMRSNRDVSIRLTFSEGNASIRFWASDLTEEYVRFNSEYTT